MIEMQETRYCILEILQNRDEATVEEIVDELLTRRGDITAVTVRHHLSILQKENLIEETALRRSPTPGRPRHQYRLTQKALSIFPNNYEKFALGLLRQIKETLPPESVNVILEGVACGLADEACIPSEPMPKRLDAVVAYLSQHGYVASWEEADDAFILHTSNCPYRNASQQHDQLMCDMDMRFIAKLLGVVPRRLASISQGDARCSYSIPANMGLKTS